jgi:hypothetical protein
MGRPSAGFFLARYVSEYSLRMKPAPLQVFRDRRVLTRSDAFCAPAMPDYGRGPLRAFWRVIRGRRGMSAAVPVTVAHCARRVRRARVHPVRVRAWTWARSSVRMCVHVRALAGLRGPTRAGVRVCARARVRLGRVCGCAGACTRLVLGRGKFFRPSCAGRPRKLPGAL